MAAIYVDGKKFEVRDGTNLLDACQGLGLDLPYFCWHPELHSVGACRQCAVKEFKDDKDQKGRIVMSCITAVRDGARISIDDAEVRAFRKSVIEWLMLNHPHDCPVCDEGGECHLQDMTVLTGHAYRRSRFRKSTYTNQDLGPFVTHSMDRCIQCYRCVRFYRDYAGGADFNVFASHRNVYFGRQADGRLESPFSGNLVEVCPTGVFTDKTLADHYTRKWDLQTAPSVCVHCSLGCNTIPGERYNKLRRTRNRYNGAVNGYFLCDRGRYGYGFVNSGKRLLLPHTRDRSSGQLRIIGIPEILSAIRPAKGLIGIGSPRASLESNFALRELVGPQNFHCGIPDSERELAALALEMAGGPVRIASLRDVQKCDAVLVLGEDAENTAPVLSLNLRQSVRNKPLERAKALKIPLWDANAVKEAIQDRKGPLFTATVSKTPMDGYATKSLVLPPADIARLGFAVAHELDPASPAVSGLERGTARLARNMAEELKHASRPLIVSGTCQGDAGVLRSACQVAIALEKITGRGEIFLVMPECNSPGMAMLGGRLLSDAFKAVEEGAADTAIILENDLFTRAGKDSVTDFLYKCRAVITLDHIETQTALQSDYVLPVGTYAESSGTYVNNEFRAQRFFRVMTPGYPGDAEIIEGWRRLAQLAASAGIGRLASWRRLDDVINAIASEIPALAGIRDAAPMADFRATGMKVPRQPDGYSGRTAMHADRSVHEPAPPPDPDSPLDYSMEGYPGQPPPALVPRFRVPGWNSIQALNRFQQETGGPLRGGDPGKRLFEPVRGKSISFNKNIPERFLKEEGKLLLLPAFSVFGSEELSSLSPWIAGLAPPPSLTLSPEDAVPLGIAEGKPVETGGMSYTVRISPEVEPGTALVTVLGGAPGGLPRLARIRKVEGS